MKASHAAAAVAAVIATASPALTACGGGTGEDRPDRAATLVLDSAPRAVHAGIYLTLAREFDGAEGAELELKAPSPADTAQVLVDGGAQLAILGIRDLARARARGHDVVGVMALVQQPLGGDAGAPPHPPLLLAAARETVRDDPAIVRATIRALRRGHRETLLDPESAVTALVDAEPGLDRTTVQRELAAIAPAFTAGRGGFGALDRRRLQAWARWAARTGIVERAPDVERAFDFSFT